MCFFIHLCLRIYVGVFSYFQQVAKVVLQKCFDVRTKRTKITYIKQIRIRNKAIRNNKRKCFALLRAIRNNQKILAVR